MTPEFEDWKSMELIPVIKATIKNALKGLYKLVDDNVFLHNLMNGIAEFDSLKSGEADINAVIKAMIDEFHKQVPESEETEAVFIGLFAGLSIAAFSLERIKDTLDDFDRINEI